MPRRALLSWFSAASPHGVAATPSLYAAGSLRAWHPGPRAHDVLRWMLLGLLIAYWAALLRPPALGGDTEYVFVRGTSMYPTYEGGDLVVIRKQRAYRVGDVVAFTPAGSTAHVIHRIVGVDGERYVMQGDNRNAIDPWRPTAEEINGKPMFMVPQLGRYLLLIAGSPAAQAGAAAVATFLTVAWPRRTPRPAPLTGR